MIKLSSVAKRYGSRDLFTEISLSLDAGARLSLFGRNGSGKSTILKIIAGEIEIDDGEISMPRGYRIGFIRQHLSFSAPTVLEEACAGVEAHRQYQAEMVLAGLGFSTADLHVSPHALSGGFQIRINLAKLILAEPNLLLLDEPTNYLDIISIRWLERYLSRWPGELILISHDRTFCDAVSTHSALIRRGVVKVVRGDSEKLYSQIAEEEEQHEQTRQNVEKQRKQMEVFINRFRAKASKASVVQSRIKALDRLGRVDELQDESVLDFAFPVAPFPGKFPLEVEGLTFGYSAGIEPLIRDLSLTMKKDDRLGIIGKNGRGKSTLLRLFAQELDPLAGTIRYSPNARLGYFGQTNIDLLDPRLTVYQEVEKANIDLSPREIRSICGMMMFSSGEAEKKVSVLSGGERSRVLLGKLLATKTNVLLLDEPTNHLDVESVLALTGALEEFEGAVCIVTHNEELLREVTKRLVVFQGSVPFLFEGGYDDFLSRIGWREEQEDGDTTESKAAPSRDKKRERAELVQEKARILNPLKRQLKSIEDSIAKLEKEVVTVEHGLVEASQRNDGKTIAELSKALEVAKRSLAENYEQWERVGGEVEEKTKLYEGLLGGSRAGD